MNFMDSSKTKIVDQFGRNHDYLRISFTERCNLRCIYCMPEEGIQLREKSEFMTSEEVLAIAKTFVGMGIKKIRLTGGEPLIRRDIIKLVSAISALPFLDEVTMTTNGMLLPKMAQPLKDAGMNRLNISVDSLRPDRFKALTRLGDLDVWHKGIRAAKTANFTKLKLNAVILSGFNDDEVLDLARYAIDNQMDISFIEEMPLGEISSHKRVNTQITSQALRDQLETEFELTDSVETTGGPSRYVRVAGSDSKIGFISPMSNNFCDSCNRVRMTAEGRLLLCLGNEQSMDLRAVMRSHPGDSALLRSKIVQALQDKPERHEFDPNRTDIVRFMNMTGG